MSSATGVVYHNPTHGKYKLKIVRYDLGSKNMTTLSGSGLSGFKDGVASVAQFKTFSNQGWHGVGALAVDDATGNVFLSDTWNRRIRMIRPNGRMSTHAGNGKTGYKDGVGTVATLEAPGMMLQEHCAATRHHCLHTRATRGRVSVGVQP